MDIQGVNGRIDQVLGSNKRHETAVIVMSVFIFLLGMTALVYGMIQGNVYIVAPSTIFSGLLYWPIRQILKIRKDNIALATVPTLIATLPKEDAARELVKLLEKISS
jgi:hypothetical protein